MIDSVWSYHERTRYDRYDMKGHALDWGSQPNVYKNYHGRKTVRLPQDVRLPDETLSELLTEPWTPDAENEISLDRLTRILVLTQALTARARYGGAYFFYRSVASAGALYPFELYVATIGVSGLDAGLYYHNLSDQSLVLLRSGSALGPVRSALSLGDKPDPVLVFFLSSIFFRSSWKYRERSYRYHLLDTGHLAENLVLALRSERLRCEIRYDFDDLLVNGLLGVDQEREVCLAVAPVWGRSSSAPQFTVLEEADNGLADASRVASAEVDYPAIREVHGATRVPTTLPSSRPNMARCLGVELQQGKPILPPEMWPERISYGEAVQKRRSMRNFVRASLTSDRLNAFLTLLTVEPAANLHRESVAEAALSIGFLAGNVERLEPGFYVLDRAARTVHLAVRGNVIERMTDACLNQGWLAQCAVHFVFLCNLDVLEKTWGARAYRHVMLFAGRLGQRIYLAATSMLLGCCGIGAYYDGEAVQLLGLNERSRLLYLVATGPVRKYVER